MIGLWDKWRADWTKETEHGLRIDIAPLIGFPAAKTLLFEYLKEYGFSSRQTEQVYQSLGHEPGAVFYSSTHRLLLDRECLICTRREQENRALTYDVMIVDSFVQFYNGKLQISRLQNRPAEWPKDPFEALLERRPVDLSALRTALGSGRPLCPLGYAGASSKGTGFFFQSKKSPFLKRKKSGCWLTATEKLPG